MTGTVDAFVTQPHYADHLWPIMDALPEELRGTMYATRDLRGQLDRPAVWSWPPESSMPLLVAGFQDLMYTRRAKCHVQHGSGQRYNGLDSPSYAGGPGRELVDLFIVPNAGVGALERARYPHARVAAVGCAKLDAWKAIPLPRNAEPVVAVTFHWNSHIGVAEGRWAWPTWRDTIEQLAKVARVVGHAHPRARRELAPWWESIGVEYVPRAVDLLERCDVLVLDNSSIGFEWAACDRPTVWLDSADWRDYHHDPAAQHGLRFGDQLPGPCLPASMTSVRELVDAINASIDRFTLARAEVRQSVYGPDDRNASARAAQAVLELVEHGPNPRTYQEPRPCTSC